jgi:hypothetical protein
MENLNHVSSLVSDNLQMVGDRVLKCREVVDYFQQYLEIFTGDQIPEPQAHLKILPYNLSHLHS